MTFSAPLRVNVQLEVKETGEVKEQELFMGDFPLMTPNGTFVINGAERVVVSQLVRSPGVYFTLETDPTTGRELCYGKLIPNRGAWLEFETSNKNVLSVKVDRKRKIPVTTLLRAIDEEEGVPEARARARTSASSRSSPTSTRTRTTRTSRRRSRRRRPTNKTEALLEFYRRLRPGDPPTLENARGLLNSLFFNPPPLRPGPRRPLQAEPPARAGHGAEDAHPAAARPRDDHHARRSQLNNGIGHPDDIDHLGNRRVRAVGELIQNQFRIGLLRMERVVRERMTIIDPDQATPSALINIRPVVASMKEFFGGSQLSQFMDQTNPLAELTHKRRLSALGPGGLSRDRAGFDVRDVHHSHYGRICPIETPEGPNIGLIGSLATYGVINQLRLHRDAVPARDQGAAGRLAGVGRALPGARTSTASATPARRSTRRVREEARAQGRPDDQVPPVRQLADRVPGGGRRKTSTSSRRRTRCSTRTTTSSRSASRRAQASAS